METIPSTSVDRLEQALCALAPAERVIAEQLDAIATPLIAAVEAIEISAAPDEASAPTDAADGPGEAAHASSLDAGAMVRAAMLDVGALAALESMAVALPDPTRRAAFLAELRGLLHRGANPGPPDPNPTGQLYDLFADTSEIPPLEDRVRKVAGELADWKLFGGPIPAGGALAASAVPTARMRRRFVAYMLDQGPVQIAAFMLAFYAVALGWIHADLLVRWVGVAVTFGAALVNGILLSRTGTTLGKFAMGLRVVPRGGGDRVSLRTGIFRETLGRLMNATLLGAGYLAGIGHPLHQTWGDRSAGTLVVRDGGRLRVRGVVGALAAATLVTATLMSYASIHERRSIQADLLPNAAESLRVANTAILLYATRPSADDSECVRDMRLILEETPRVHRLVHHLRAQIAKAEIFAKVLMPWRQSALAYNEGIYALMDERADRVERFARHALLGKLGPAPEREHERRMADYLASDYFALTNQIVSLLADSTRTAL